MSRFISWSDLESLYLCMVKPGIFYKQNQTSFQHRSGLEGLYLSGSVSSLSEQPVTWWWKRSPDSCWSTHLHELTAGFSQVSTDSLRLSAVVESCLSSLTACCYGINYSINKPFWYRNNKFQLKSLTGTMPWVWPSGLWEVFRTSMVRSK